MNAKPYIGVTGIVTMDDVRTIAECVQMLPPTHRLMAGVLVSAKTLRGQSTTNRRYPPVDDVGGLLAELDNVGAWPVVHFNCREDLPEHLDTLAQRFFLARGLQLNVVRPDVEAVAKFTAQRRDMAFILQVNRGAVPRATEITARVVLDYVARYDTVASYALLDLSGGEGRAMSPDLAWQVLDQWRWEGPAPAFAGGLGPDANDLLTEFAAGLREPRRFSMCSFDAESKLRTAVGDPVPEAPYQDQLDAAKTTAWVAAVCRLIRVCA